MESIFGLSIPLMQKSLDCLWKKQEVTLDNLANAETPHYKAKYVTFEEELKQRIEAAGHRGDDAVKEAIRNTKVMVHTTAGETNKLDGNNVNADTEMVELTKTTMEYQYALNALNSDMARIRTAIKS